MPYILPEQKIAVFFSPKSAGTSIRSFLFEIENGFPFRPYKVQGVSVRDNSLVANNRWAVVDHRALAGFRRFAVVRDPVRRFLSAYSNRVVHYRELSEKAAGTELQKVGLTPDPDLETFVDNYRVYRKCSASILRHFLPQDRFLGKKASYFERLFQVESLGSFVDHLNGICGATATLPRLQDGGPKIAFDELPEKLRRAILAIVGESVIFDWVPDYKERYADYFPARQI